MLVDVLAFYGFQFNDYWTTVLGIRLGAEEKNPVASPLVGSPLWLALYKFGLATFALIITLFMMQFFSWFEWFIYGDTIAEAVVTMNNLWAIYRHKVRA